MKRLVLILLMLCLVSPVFAVEIKNNLQAFDSTYFVTQGGTSDGNLAVFPSTGEVYWSNVTNGPTIVNYPPQPMGYAAVDMRHDTGGLQYKAILYDGFGVAIQTVTSTAFPSANVWHRVELYVNNSLSFTPEIYIDGVYSGSGVAMITNPQSIKFFVTGVTTKCDFDNMVYATSNTHTTSPPPVNWTIVRDFLNPSATGVYALDALGTSYILKNSNAFYITADSSRLGAFHPVVEAFRIYRADGTIVNSTAFDTSSAIRRQFAYSVNPSDGTAYFFNNPSVTDGLYYAAFDNFTPLTQDYFFVTSSGGFINFDKTSYIIGDPGIITWSISAAYYTPATHTYSYKIKDIFGNTVSTYTITSATGSNIVTFNSATYSQGVYYVYLIATSKTTGTESVLGTDGTTILDYTTFHGTVYDALTTLPLSGALVNFSQLGTVQQVTVPASAEYSLSTFVTGSRINVSVTNAGYAEYNYTFIPLRNVNVSLDFALVPLPTNSTGVGIGGVAREFTYGQLIPSASITVYNVTAGTSYVRTANIRGYYQCSAKESCTLARNREYTVFGRKTGYADSANYLVVVT